MVKICTASSMETRQRDNLLLVGHREKEGRADVVSIQGVPFLSSYKNAYNLTLCLVHSLFVRIYIAHSRPVVYILCHLHDRNWYLIFKLKNVTESADVVDPRTKCSGRTELCIWTEGIINYICANFRFMWPFIINVGEERINGWQNQARIYARAPRARAQGGKFSGAAY